MLFESDPISITSSNITVTSSVGTYSGSGTQSQVLFSKCTPGAGSLDYTGNGFTEQGSYVTTCGRQWTFGQAFSPAGVKFSFGTRHALQPYAIGSLGYMYTSRAVRIADASPFNYLIQAGGGVEIYRSRHRSVAAECLLSHFSNWNTADANPGTDQVVYRVAYNFGR